VCFCSVRFRNYGRLDRYNVAFGSLCGKVYGEMNVSELSASCCAILQPPPFFGLCDCEVDIDRIESRVEKSSCRKLGNHLVVATRN
jgi:hypothetical protein